MAASRKVNDFSVAPMLLQSMRQEQAGSNEGDESLRVEEVGDRQPRITLWLCQNSYWKWPFIVDFPIKNGDFP